MVPSHLDRVRLEVDSSEPIGQRSTGGRQAETHSARHITPCSHHDTRPCVILRVCVCVRACVHVCVCVCMTHTQQMSVLFVSCMLCVCTLFVCITKTDFSSIPALRLGLDKLRFFLTRLCFSVMLITCAYYAFKVNLLCSKTLLITMVNILKITSYRKGDNSISIITESES